MFEKKKKKTNKRFKSKVQSPNFWSTFCRFSSFFSSCLSSILEGWIWCFGPSLCFLVAVCIAFSQFSSYFCSLAYRFPSFHPTLQFASQFPGLQYIASQLTHSLHPSYHPSLQCIASQLTRSLHPSYHPGLQCITSQLNPRHDGSSMQSHCMASQFRSLHPSLRPSLYRSIAVCIPVCL